jgi:hypothetical protein
MTNQDSDGLFDSERDDRSELAWTETDWERYLAARRQAVADYAAHYEKLPATADRIDLVAQKMGWALAEDECADEEIDEGDEIDIPGDWEPYTTQGNPVYVSTEAIHGSLLSAWEALVAKGGGRIPVALALGGQSALHHMHTHALHGIQALEMGDYTLAVCFLKRALRALNEGMALLDPSPPLVGALAEYAAYARPRFFDLREIWLRVMAECRAETDEE